MGDENKCEGCGGTLCPNCGGCSACGTCTCK